MRAYAMRPAMRADAMRVLVTFVKVVLKALA
jgi:hypothetical protein